MAQRGRPRKNPAPLHGSVTVQMSDDPNELDALLAAANQPRQPREPGPDDPEPPRDPSSIPDEDIPPPTPADIPDEGGEEDDVPSEEENGSPDEDEDDGVKEERPADPPGSAAPHDRAGAGDPPGTAAATHAGSAGAVPEDFSNVPAPNRYAKAVGLDGEIIPKVQRYESRISIVDAYQYPGSLQFAPDWVDRNWVAFADNYDPVRDMEPGPALRVPTYRGDTVLCRKGDYVARQEVILTHDLPGELKIEVWEKEQFERLFIPAKPGAPEVVRPWDPNPDPMSSRLPTPEAADVEPASA